LWESGNVESRESEEEEKDRKRVAFGNVREERNKWIPDKV